MTLKEIVAKCSGLDVHEERAAEEEYSEVVFFSKDTEAWVKVLAQDLGVPVKPAGTEPTQEHSKLTDEFGGIFANQVLFKKDFNDSTVLAMLWPWQDKTYTTLKLVLLKK